MSDKLDICRFFPTLGGTTDWTPSAAVTGYQSPTSAGVVTNAPYSYRAESGDLTQWEIGTGLFDGTKFLRTTVLYNSSGTGTLQSGAGTKINFSGVPQVAIVILIADVTPTITPQGRLTLTSGTAVMQTSVAGATRVYWTPYGGNRCPVKYGTRSISEVFAEVFQDTTDTTKSPAAVAASKNYDAFFWNDAGTQRCTRGPTWNSGAVAGSDTARGTGAGSTELILLSDGLLWNKNDITNGPAAQKGLYVGSIRSNAASTIDFIFGAAGSGGVAGVLNVWNAYNRVDVGCTIIDSGSAHNYSTATIRQWAGAATMQVSFIVGLAEDVVDMAFSAFLTPPVINAIGRIGLGLDSITAWTFQGFYAAYGANISHTMPVPGKWNPGIGAHYVAGLEEGDGNATSFFGGTTGLSFSLRM